MEYLDLVIAYIREVPWFATLTMLMGSLRIIFKPIFSALDKYVQSTPSTTDDTKWARIKNMKGMRTFVWLLDFFASVKVPMPPKKE